MTRSLCARTAALLRRIADHLEPRAPTREPAAAPVHDTAALAVGLEDRIRAALLHRRGQSLRAWCHALAADGEDQQRL